MYDNIIRSQPSIPILFISTRNMQYNIYSVNIHIKIGYQTNNRFITATLIIKPTLIILTLALKHTESI